MSNVSKIYPIQTGEKNQILRKVSKKVELLDDEIIDFAKILMDLMREYKGVGLAAPQIGKNIRMIATAQLKITKKEDKIVGETIMINPEIIEKSKEMISSQEACLSLPELVGDVKRHKKIKVQYLDVKGKSFSKKFEDMNAIIIQHEIDHLDGILFTDKAKNIHTA